MNPNSDNERKTTNSFLNFTFTFHSPTFIIVFFRMIFYEKIGNPQDMITELKRIVDTDRRLGYVSIQEFVREAVRRSVIEYGGLSSKIIED